MSSDSVLQPEAMSPPDADSNVVIEAKGLGKSYRIYKRPDGY